MQTKEKEKRKTEKRKTEKRKKKKVILTFSRQN